MSVEIEMTNIFKSGIHSQLHIIIRTGLLIGTLIFDLIIYFLVNRFIMHKYSILY
jgi:hypothetical protein